MGILSTLLTEIDGFGGDASASKNKPILIVGATNRPEHIDDALMRPGRFDKLIHIPAPDEEGRLKILQFILKKMPVEKDFDICSVAERTVNFSGADLVNLCNEAALCAATRDFNCEHIKKEDFETVLTFLRPSLSEEKIKYYEKYEKKRGRKL
jgi:ATP-dependent Zn protease